MAPPREDEEVAVRGVVVDDTGAPVPAASVVLGPTFFSRGHGHFSRRWRWSGETGADGMFEARMSALEVGDSPGEPFGLATATLDPWARGSRYPDQSSVAAVRAGESRALLRFVIPRRATIEVRVVDADGSPVEGATVACYRRPEGRPPGHHACHRCDGTLPPPSQASSETSAAPPIPCPRKFDAPSRCGFPPPEPPPSGGPPSTPTPPADGDGQTPTPPPEGGSGDAFPPPHTQRVAASESTDASGFTRVERMEPGGDWIVFAEAGNARSDPLPLGAPIAPGETRSITARIPTWRVTDVPRTGPWILAGVVVDSTGAPVADAEFWGNLPDYGDDRGRRSGDDGRFRLILSWLPEPGDRAALGVRAEGLGQREVVLDDALLALLRGRGRAEDARIVLRPEARVRGRVLDRAGRPIRRAEVSVTSDATGRSPAAAGWERTRAEADGAFALAGFDESEPLYLYADADRFTPVRVPLAGCLRAGEVLDVDVVLRPAREVPAEISIDGWRDGMWLRIDLGGARLDGPRWTGRLDAGPTEVTLHDAADHPVAHDAFDVPPDAAAFFRVVVAPPCAECAER